MHLNEGRISDAKINKGSMHKLLNIDPNDAITTKYKNGESLAKALLRATNNDYDTVIGKLAYAHNVSRNRDIFGTALKYVISKKKEGKNDIE